MPPVANGEAKGVFSQRYPDRGSFMAGPAIVVIGASMGGVSAVQRLLKCLPIDLPAAMFIVLHRPPVQRQQDPLPKILSRESPLPVHAAADLQRFQPANVYICPSDHYLSIENGLIRMERSPIENRFRPSVDVLFRSAASAYGRQVVGIVLTGLLNDGTAGLWQIKKRGGITIVQDPVDAQCPSMPQSAIDNVAVDYVLPIEKIPQKLVELTQREPFGPSHGEVAAKVLIVEDERIVAKNLEERLQELGYQVTGSVESGEAAIKVVSQSPPDLVLMDIHLAGSITGIEAARRIWERWQVPSCMGQPTPIRTL